MLVKSIPHLPKEYEFDAPMLLYNMFSLEMRLVSSFAASEQPPLTETMRPLLLCSEWCQSFGKESFNAKPSVELPLPRTVVLRARNLFLSRLDDGDNTLSWERTPATGGGPHGDTLRSLFAPGSPRAFVLLCFSWLEYFTSGIDAGLEAIHMYGLSHIHDSTRTRSRWGIGSRIQKGSPQHEWLLTCRLRMLVFHSTRSLSPPKLLRELVREALSVFPANALFLSLLIRSEGQGYLSANLRRYFDESVATSTAIGGAHVSPVIWVYSILSELPRSGVAYRIVGLFEKAVLTSAGSMPALWRLYIHYHLSTGNVEAAKRTFYRAIHRCPWSKVLWMDGVESVFLLGSSPLSTSVSSLMSIEERASNESEVGSIIDLMVEKELRVRSLPAGHEEDLPSGGEDEI